MRHALYSELRTLYEATADNPRTFRVTMKMKDMIDETVLVNAVRKSMERYPYYRVRLGMDCVQIQAAYGLMAGTTR